MSISGPSIDTPPIQKRPAMLIEPEAKKAALDEEERRKRVTMNRQRSRSSLPLLQDRVNTMSFSKKL